MTTTTTTTTAPKPTTTISSNGSNSSRAPLVHWAQRADTLLLTIDIEDCQQPQIDLDKDKLYFKGKSDSIQSDADHSVHEVTIDFYSPINIEESKHATKGRGIEFVIVKEEVKWWPRLTKDSAKKHWLKVDFLKWKDEDDSEDEMGAMGGMGGMGMGGMGMGGMGMGGMGGMGQPDFGDLMQQFKGIGGDAGALGDEGDEDFESDEEDETQQPPPDLE